MLLELRAENYAVIDHAVAEFGPGLNLLTGETGAGKSILIDALMLLLGEKATPDIVRHGAEKAVVGCVFEITPGAEATLEAAGIDAHGGEILLRREIQANGKGRVFVNNQAATVGVLRSLAPELALVHAQSETLGSFDQAQQRGLVDRCGGIQTERVAWTFTEWQRVRGRLADLEQDEQERLHKVDLWSFQKREIEQAQLVAGEEELLIAEKRRLANAEKLLTAARTAHDVLYESAESAEVALSAGLKQLEELAKYDARFAEPVLQVASARAAVGEASALARDFAEEIQASPERLEEIEDRLALMDRLKRKYGASIDGVIGYGVETSQKLAEIENRDQLSADLRRELEAAEKAYAAAAQELTKQRTAAAGRLQKMAEKQINDLAMKVKFEIHISPAEGEWTPHGWDTVECRIATNAGEPLKPLYEIASGGEMSRVMLALKVSVEDISVGPGDGLPNGRGKKKTQLPRTLVFDEIDIGIGGRAAEAVGQKLKALSRVQQVICITHLPQVAAFADQHFLIEKREQGGRTKTGVRLLDAGERTEEIARMMSGAKVTESSREHAQQMLKASAALPRG